jgi:hypothetical protein
MGFLNGTDREQDDWKSVSGWRIWKIPLWRDRRK